MTIDKEKLLQAFPPGAMRVNGFDVGTAIRELIAVAPTPPQPIYDEASERDRFDAEFEKICCRTGITIREIAWRMWQSRAKAGEVGHE